jgi:hypothetical protein
MIPQLPITICRGIVGPAVLALALLLGACSTPNPHAPSELTAFTRNSAEGIVIVGVRSAVPYGTVLGIPVYQRVKLTWAATQPDGTPVARATPVEVGTKVAPYGLPGGDAPQDMRWHVLRLPPGTYKITKIQGITDRAGFTTNASPLEYTPFFTVKAGEVRYIGDLHCDVKSFPAKILKLTREDAMARKALAEYPIHVPPYFRAPAYLPAGQTVAVMMKVSD